MSLRIVSSLTQFAPRQPEDGPDSVVEAARTAEADGVDELLIGYTATTPDGWTMASYALANTSSMEILLAHRPGIMSPVLAARMAATLSVLSSGRLNLNIVAGGSRADQLREGDHVDHDDRYRRAIEYVDVLKAMWTSEAPFDYQGQFFDISQAYCRLKPSVEIPIYMGGASSAATTFAAQHADVYMSWSEPVGMVKDRFSEVREACKDSGRPPPGFSVSMRLIIRETEEEAWSFAESLLPDDIEERRGRALHAEDSGRNRQLSLVRENLVHDERFWTGLTASSGGQGSTGCLVGTEDQVLDALLRYVEEAGANTLLLTGHDGAYAEFPPGFLGRLRRLSGSDPGSGD